MHRVTYTNLAPGTYILKVKATNSDGYAGTEEASLKIVILPPFWMTPWAYIVYALLIVGVVSFSLYAVQRRERNKFRIRQIEEDAKKREELSQMKFRFFTNVSHELRTPLTAIKGWAETMQLSERGKLDRKTFDRGMGVIISESSRLTSIVEELLDFSRIQSGRMKLIKEKLDILAEFDDAVYFLKERAVTEGKHLLYDEPEVVYPAVYGDKNRLKQVFLNVLDNALKYTPKGGVVAAQVIYSKDEPDIIKIVITDTGCGISAEDLPKVKEKFYKANQTVGGSGIGLAVADEIMNLHNGSLDIESGEGVGTTVTLTFPVYKEGSENSLPENIKL